MGTGNEAEKGIHCLGINIGIIYQQNIIKIFFSTMFYFHLFNI